jgi:T5SS/PEP-CTERM-associated repeat protein
MNSRANKQKLAVTVAVIGMAVMARAQSATWSADPGDGYWTNAANWTAGGPTMAGGNATFSYARANPYTVIFTEDVFANIVLGSTTPGVDATFDLGGYTLTKDNTPGNFDVNRYAELTVLDGTILIPNTPAQQRDFHIGYHDTSLTPLGAVSSVTIGSGGVIDFQSRIFNVAAKYLGMLTITNGGTLLTDSVNAQGFYIANTVNSAAENYSTGTMTISGAGSAWTNNAVNNSLSEFRVAGHANATGTLNIVNGGVAVHKAGNVWVGANGEGHLNIAGGGRFIMQPVANARILYVGVNAGSQGNVTVGGANSLLLLDGAASNLEFRVGNSSGAVGNVNVFDQGVVDVQGKVFHVGSTGSGNVTVSSGGLLLTTNLVAANPAVIANNAGATGVVTVTGSGSVWTNGRLGVANNIRLGNAVNTSGTLNITDYGRVVNLGLANSSYIGAVGTGEMNVLSGGRFEYGLTSSFQALVVAQGAGFEGRLLVSGADSTVDTSVTNGALYAGYVAGAKAVVIVESNGWVKTHSMIVGLRSTDAVAIIREGGQLQAATGTGSLGVGHDSGLATQTGHGILIVTGAVSRVLAGDLTIANRNSTGDVVVADGGTLECYRNILVGAITNVLGSGRASLRVTGADSVVKRTALTAGELPFANWTALSPLGVGAGAGNMWSSTGGLPSDSTVRTKAELTVDHGGRVSVNGRIIVYSNSTVRVNGGRIETSNVIGLEEGSQFHATLTAGDANSTALMAASSEVRIWGAELVVELGADFTPVADDVYTLISAGTLSAPYNRFSCGGLVLEDGAVIQAGGTTFKVGYTANAVTLTVRQTGTMIRVL